MVWLPDSILWLRQPTMTAGRELKRYDALKKCMDEAGISPAYHTPHILEFLLQREMVADARITALERHLGRKALKQAAKEAIEG